MPEMQGATNRCALCEREQQSSDLAHGAKGAICRACVGEGVSTTLRGTASVRDGDSTPRSYVQCRICGQPTPPSALHELGAARTACARCLSEAYSLLAQTLELSDRRRLSFGESEDRYAATLLARHFEGLAAEEVVTTSRTYPTYLRVDLQRVLDESSVARDAMSAFTAATASRR
jgi:hypothetical protein